MSANLIHFCLPSQMTGSTRRKTQFYSPLHIHCLTQYTEYIRDLVNTSKGRSSFKQTLPPYIPCLRQGFLSLGTIDTLDQIILGCRRLSCSLVGWCSSTPGVYILDTSNTTTTFQAVKSKHGSRYHQMYLGEKNRERVENH